MNREMTRGEKIALLFKKAKELPEFIADLEQEIRGKESVLNGAYKDFKKGHPHFSFKKQMEENLVKDKKDLIAKKGLLVSTKDQLDMYLTGKR